MRLFMFFLTMNTLFSIANADSFTIIRDEKEYLCEQTGRIDHGGYDDCIQKAYRGVFTAEEAVQICTGARSTAPAECASNAYLGIFTREESIALCIYSRSSTGPVDCATKAYAGPFSREETIELCSGNTTGANAECALKAYAGPYSRSEAIRMCKGQYPQLVLRSLELIEKSRDLKPKVDAIKKNLITK